MRLAAAGSEGWRRFARWLRHRMPRGLYARSLLIIILPMVLLQSIVAFIFMERHWQLVTQHLSTAVTRDIAAIIDMIETFPPGDNYAEVIRIAQERLSLKVDILPPDPLPPPGPKPFFSILDQILSAEITKQINRPFWIDTVGNSSIVEVRVQLEGKVLRVFARRGYAATKIGVFLDQKNIIADFSSFERGGQTTYTATHNQYRTIACSVTHAKPP